MRYLDKIMLRFFSTLSGVRRQTPKVLVTTSFSKKLSKTVVTMRCPHAAIITSISTYDRPFGTGVESVFLSYAARNKSRSYERLF